MRLYFKLTPNNESVPHEIDGDDKDKMSFLSVSVESASRATKIASSAPFLLLY